MKFKPIECGYVHDDAAENDREYPGTNQRNTGLCTDTANGVAQRNQPVLGKDLFESQGTQSLEIACEKKAQNDGPQRLGGGQEIVGRIRTYSYGIQFKRQKILNDAGA